mmetsp:Transcript_67559/g.162207  ORF Transcript_67559/g.162207 Transcript_67559/m.162207 type:complete len:976 (-) Transcript_67559:23-2950(-)
MPRVPLFGGKKHHSKQQQQPGAPIAAVEEKPETVAQDGDSEQAETPRLGVDASAAPDLAEDISCPNSPHSVRQHSSKGGLFGRSRHSKRSEKAAEAAQREAEHEELRREVEELHEELDEVQERLEMAQSTATHLEDQFREERTKSTALQVAVQSFDEKSQELESARTTSDTQRRAMVVQLTTEASAHRAAAEEAEVKLQSAELSLSESKQGLEKLEAEAQRVKLCWKSLEALPVLQGELSDALQLESSVHAAESRSMTACSELRSTLDEAKQKARSSLLEASTMADGASSSRQEVSALRKAAAKLRRKLVVLSDEEAALSAYAKEALGNSAATSSTSPPWPTTEFAGASETACSSRWRSEVQERDEMIAELSAKLPKHLTAPTLESIMLDRGGQSPDVSDAEDAIEAPASSVFKEEHDAAQAACAKLRTEIAELRRSRDDAASEQVQVQEILAKQRHSLAEEASQCAEELREMKASTSQFHAASNQLLAELGQERVARAVAVSEALADSSLVHAASMQDVDSSKRGLLGELQQLQAEVVAGRADFTVKFAEGVAEKEAQHAAKVQVCQHDYNMLECQRNELQAEVRAARLSTDATVAEEVAEAVAVHTIKAQKLEESTQLLRCQEAELRAEVSYQLQAGAELMEAAHANQVGDLTGKNVRLQQEIDAMQEALGSESGQAPHEVTVLDAQALQSERPAAGLATQRAQSELETLRADLAQERGRNRSLQASLASAAAVSRSLQSQEEAEDLKDRIESLEHGLRVMSEMAEDGGSETAGVPPSLRQAMELSTESGQLQRELRKANDELLAIPEHLNRRETAAFGWDYPSQPGSGPVASAAAALPAAREVPAGVIRELQAEISSERAAYAEAREETRQVHQKRLQSATLDAASQKLEQQLSEEVQRSRRLGEYALQAEESRRRLLHELAEAAQVEADLTSLASLMGRAAKSITVITREARTCTIPNGAPTPARSSSLLV